MFNSKDLAIIDVGSDKIFVNVGYITKENTFEVTSSAEMSYDGFQDGDWLDGDNVKNAVLGCLNKALYSTKTRLSSIYVSVPGDFSKLQVVENNLNFGCDHKITSNDLENLNNTDQVEFDGRYQIINSSVVCYFLDGKEKTMQAKGKNCFSLSAVVSFVLAKISYCEMFKTILADYSKKIHFISSPWAQSVCLIDEETRFKNAAVVCNIGYLNTDVAYISGDGLLNLDTFAMGGGHISYDLSYGVKVPFDTACYIKSNIDFYNRVPVVKNMQIRTDNGVEEIDIAYINMIATARLEEICNKIKEIVANYQLEYPKYLKIYFTGRGIEDMRGVRTILTSLLDRSCEVLNTSILEDTNKTYTSTSCLMQVVCNSRTPIVKSVISNIISLFK